MASFYIISKCYTNAYFKDKKDKDLYEHWFI